MASALSAARAGDGAALEARHVAAGREGGVAVDRPVGDAEQHLPLLRRIGSGRDLDLAGRDRTLELGAVLSAIERSDSDSVPRLWATAIFSAIRGVTSKVTLEKVLDLGLAVFVLLADPLVGGEHADVADDRFGDLERRAVAAALTFWVRTMSTWSPGKTKPATPVDDVHRNRDGAHSGAERRGEEAAVLRSDERAAGNRLAGGDRIADDRAEQLLEDRRRASLRYNKRSASAPLARADRRGFRHR